MYTCITAYAQGEIEAIDQVKAGLNPPHTETQTYRQVFATKTGQSVNRTRNALAKSNRFRH